MSANPRSSFQTHFERLELKYLVDEARAESIRAAIAPYCTRDPHARTHHQGLPGYPIRSLYLDSPSLGFHRAKERGDPVRTKLRIRRYLGTEVTCLEVKRRIGDVVQKQRALVPADDLRSTALGLRPLHGSAASNGAADDFAHTALQYGALPSLLVDYVRDAYHSEIDPYARVTFDRQIRFQRTERWSFDARPERWLHLDDHAHMATRPVIVLELKCSNRVPLWMMDLIRKHGLGRSSVSKYSIGIYTARRVEDRVRGQERAREMFR